ncbi:hypothetical protein V6N11_084161 [Hibiscus sabdariffa]|uniref:Uncharacterized protein n=1 Tax=Hibiscus sabdariffa TaxID=183260 RepID=A0ABR1ZDF8_9ROSI
MAREEGDVATQLVAEADADKSTRDVVAMLEMRVDELSTSMKDVQGVFEVKNYRRDKLDSLGFEHDNEAHQAKGFIPPQTVVVNDYPEKKCIHANTSGEVSWGRRGVLGRVGSHHCRDSLMPWLVLGKSEVVIVEATVYAAFGRRWVVTAFGHRWVVAAVVSSGLETLASKVRPCGGSSCVRLG